MRPGALFNSCFIFAFQFSEQNNQSLSILTFAPVIDDDGKYLTCRAENPSIPDSALEDKWRLNVHCKLYLSCLRTILYSKGTRKTKRKKLSEAAAILYSSIATTIILPNARANPYLHSTSILANGI